MKDILKDKIKASVMLLGIIIAAVLAFGPGTASAVGYTGPCRNPLGVPDAFQDATLTLVAHGPGTADDTYTASGYAYVHRLKSGIHWTVPVETPPGSGSFFQQFKATASIGYVADYHVRYGTFVDDEVFNGVHFSYGQLGPDVSADSITLCVKLGSPPGS